MMAAVDLITLIEIKKEKEKKLICDNITRYFSRKKKYWRPAAPESAMFVYLYILKLILHTLVSALHPPQTKCI